MGNTILLQDRYDAGVKQDLPRDKLPAGAVWYCTDLLPNLNAKLRERGGYANSSSNIATSLTTASYITGGIYAPFVAGAQNLAIDEDGYLHKFGSTGSVSSLSAGVTVAQNPVFHRDKAIIFAANGISDPRVYNGSSLTVLGGSPPTAIYGTVFTDRTVAGNTNAQPQRLYFSAAGNPASWDTTNSYIDFTYPINGLSSLRTAIMVFSAGTTSRIRGYTPPTVAGGSGDFAVDDPLWEVGCSDARSIAYWNDQVIFANGGGLHITDGAGQDDLTRRCGMKRYWQDTLMSGYVPSSWTITGGIIRDYYIVSVMNGATFKGAAVIDLRGQAWWPVTNMDFVSMWSQQGAVDELYAGRRGAARVASLSSIFVPASGVKNDGDGDAVAATLEGPFHRGKPGQKSWKRLYLTHYLQDYDADNPTVAASYITTPEDTSYTSISGTLGELSAEGRVRLPLGFASEGIALKLVRANAGDWRIGSIEAEVHTREATRI